MRFATFELFHPHGSWSQTAVALGWTNHGFPWGGGIAYHMQVLQPAQGADTRNLLPDLWHGIWTPSDYTLGSATFLTYPVGGSPLDNSSIWAVHPGPPEQFGGVYLDTHHTTMSIPIVPAPAPASLALCALALAARRRRY